MHLKIYEESKYKLLTILLLFFVGLLEMFGIGLVYPFIAILFEIDIGGEQLIEKIISILQTLRLPVTQLFLCLYIGVILLAKAVLVTLYTYIINISNIGYMISLRQKLYEAAFNSELGFISDKVSKLLNALTLMSQSAGGAMNLQFRILQNIFILLFLFILGLLISWKMFSVALSLGLLIYFLLRFTISLSKTLGQKIAELNEKLFKNLNQGLNNFRYLKSTSTYSLFYEDLRPTLLDIFKTQLKFVLIKHGTNALTEPLMVICLSIIIFFSLYILGISIAAILVMYLLLGRFYSQIILLTTNIQEYQRDYVAAVYCNDLIEEMKESREISGDDYADQNTKSDISLQDISFGHDNKLFFENASIEIKRNEITLILGPSGSGKTTLLNLILGLLVPVKGQVLLDGTGIRKFNTFALRKTIGLVTQDHALFDFTIRGNLSLRNPNVSDSELIKYIKRFKLESIFEEEIDLDYKINESSSNLSGGEKQRICLIRELVANPSILILDEFTSSLDKKSIEIVISAISELKGSKTIIIVSHQSEYMDLADTVYSVENNRLKKKSEG